MVSSSKKQAHVKKAGKKPAVKKNRKPAPTAKKAAKPVGPVKKQAPKAKPVLTVPVRRPPKVFDSGLREVPDHPIGQRAGTGYRMAADRIDGETIIGDLIVVFPRTRDALLRHGLKLDVDEAGDIYMTLDAFAAIHGLKTSALVEELVEVSRQPPPAPPQVLGPQQQRVPQLAVPSPAT